MYYCTVRIVSGSQDEAEASRGMINCGAEHRHSGKTLNLGMTINVCKPWTTKVETRKIERAKAYLEGCGAWQKSVHNRVNAVSSDESKQQNPDYNCVHRAKNREFQESFAQEVITYLRHALSVRPHPLLLNSSSLPTCLYCATNSGLPNS